MAVIWRGDRVRVAVESPYAPVGTVGFYVGGYEEESNVPSVLVRVRDGRKIRVPWKALESMEESVMDMNWSWKDDIPVSDYRHHIHTVDQARTNHGTHYELRGSSGRWFVVCTKPGEQARRTTFFVNQRTAHKVFNVLAYGATY